MQSGEGSGTGGFSIAQQLVLTSLVFPGVMRTTPAGPRLVIIRRRPLERARYRPAPWFLPHQGADPGPARYVIGASSLARNCLQ